MFTLSNSLGILAAIFTLLVVVEMLRKNRLKERHALWWLIAGILALIIGIFPEILDNVAEFVGVEVPANLIFFASIAILFFACIQNSAELTSLEEKTRTLAEEVALLRQELTDQSDETNH